MRMQGRHLAWFLAPLVVAVALAAAPGGRVQAATVHWPSISRGFGNVTIPAGTVVDGNVQVGAGNVTVDGEVTGSVAVGLGNVQVNGRIGGDLRIGVGQLTYGPHGAVGGQLDIGMGQRVQNPKATALRFVPGLLRRPFGWWGVFGPALFAPVFGILRWLATVALALPVAALFPAALAAVHDQVADQPLRSGLLGVAAMILAAPAFVLVAITIVGIPLALLGGIALVAAAFLGYVAVALWVGTALLRAFGTASPNPLWSVLAGSAAIALAGLVPLLGWLLSLATTAIGLGAILLWRLPGLRGTAPA